MNALYKNGRALCCTENKRSIYKRRGQADKMPGGLNLPVPNSKVPVFFFQLLIICTHRPLFLKRFNRRQRPTEQSRGVQRKEDLYFEPVEKVIWEFERMQGIEIDDIDTGTWEGKRLRY